MTNGQVGIIRKWCVPSYRGTVVMKAGFHQLICLDPSKQVSIGGWDNVQNLKEFDTFQIEILPAGTVLEITIE